MSQFLELFIKYLPNLLQGGEEIYQYVVKVREAAQQTDEWTDEMEQAYIAELENLKSNPPDWMRTDD